MASKNSRLYSVVFGLYFDFFYLRFLCAGQIQNRTQYKFLAFSFFLLSSFRKGGVYGETKDYEEKIRAAWLEAGAVGYSGIPLSIKITAYFAVPKSYTKKRKTEISEKGLRPTAKPDIDNIAKVVLDALNGYAYADDSAVARLECEKKYDIYNLDSEGALWIEIMPI